MDRDCQTCGRELYGVHSIKNLRKNPNVSLLLSKPSENALTNESTIDSSSTMSSTLQTLIPLLDGANTWLLWEVAMQSYLEAQGLWRLMQKGPPAALQTDAKPEEQKYYDEKLDKFEEADSKAKGSIKLRLHQSIASQIKTEKTAKEIWENLAKTYGVPGPSMAYVELRKAISIVIPDNTDPTPATNAMIAHFSRLEEMNFGVPKKKQCLILLAQLPSAMDYIVQRSNGMSTKEWDEMELATLRSLVLLHWEQHSGKKPQQQQQKAQKITAVKWGSNDAPSFSEQKGDSQKKKTRRSKKKKPTAQNAKEQEDLASGEAEQGYAQITSPIFLPQPTVLRRPTPGPSSSIYPSLNEALKITRALEVQPTIETLKRLEDLERTQDPRPCKKCSLE